ncbi:syndecan-2-B [Chanos chanos]|uniref:Syndecan n=1 Tax=Chanos chanos TaxID=29144 RepID=A0A6J2W0K9_CHACN|nr:syndecan-2-B-like [Chanos chanos]
MRNIWIFVTFCAVAWFSDKRVTAESPTDDIYLEDQSSGDYPVDDDDYSSGSGSGDGVVVEEAVTVNTLYLSPKAESTERVPQATSPSQDTPILSRDTPILTDRDSTVDHSEKGFPDSPTDEPRISIDATRTASPEIAPDGETQLDDKVHTETVFQRTEVLAAVIAGGVIGFLFAIFLILLLVYRMRKKDEGSYDLGERKPMGSAYQKAPTKEFYA